MSEEQVRVELEGLSRIRETVLASARLERGNCVVDVGAGTGLLTLGALEPIGDDGTVYAIDPSVDALEELRSHVNRGGVYYLIGEAAVLPLPDDTADVAMTRSVLIYVDDLLEAICEIFRVLRAGGRLSSYEPLNRHGTYIYNTVEWPGDLRARVLAEGDAYMNRKAGLVAFNEHDLQQKLVLAGFDSIKADIREEWEEWEVTSESADARLDAVPAAGEPSLRDRWTQTFAPDELERLVAHLRGLSGAALKFKRVSLFLSAVKP